MAYNIVYVVVSSIRLIVMCTPRYAEEYSKSASSNKAIQYSEGISRLTYEATRSFEGATARQTHIFAMGGHEYEGLQQVELAGDTVMHALKKVKRRGGGI